MSKLVKDIVDVCLKEDLQKVLQKTTELKEARLSGNDLQSRISSIAKMNKLADPNKIYAGKTLNIDDSKYTIKRGDNLTKIARSFPGAGKTPAPKPATPASVPRPAPRPATPQAPAPKPQTTSPGQVTLPPISRNAAPKPAAPPVSTASRPGLSTGKQTLPSVNVGKPKASPTPSWKDQGAVERQRMSSEKPSTAPEPDIPKVSSNRTDVEVTGTSADFGGRKYRLPAEMKDKSGGKEAGIDYGRSEKAQRGIRSFDAGKVDTSKFNYPGQVGGQSRALEPPTTSNAAPPVSAPTQEPKAPESEAPKPTSATNPDGSGARIMNRPVPTTPVKPDEPGRASYLKGAEDLANAMKGKDPNDLVPKAAKIGREPMNESFVNVGSNKYRII